MRERDTTPTGRSVEGAWERLEGWRARRYPELLLHLNPGAGEEDLRRYERATGHALPDDAWRSFGIHDGGTRHLAASLVFGLRLLPLSASPLAATPWSSRRTRGNLGPWDARCCSVRHSHRPNLGSSRSDPLARAAG